MLSPRRVRLADGLGLAAILLILVDYLRPSLLFLPTIAAGGDTPSHYPTAVWFYEQLLPRLRLQGWYPGAYAGQPLLLYYFPFAFLVMAALAPLTGMAVAFKLGTVLGIFLLPFLVYASARLMGFRFPAPLLAAASSLVFLFLEDNPIWGGTIASTLTGEFSYTYGIGLAILFLGVTYWAYSRGKGPWLPAAVLAATAMAHGYAVLWAGLSATYFLYAARRPLRTLGWLASLALVAFCLAGVLLLPLLADWRWTTPYDDAWITMTSRNIVPRHLWPSVALAALTLAGTLLEARRRGGPDHRLLFLLHASLVGAVLAAAGPALGVIDVRFVPFAQLSACLAGGAGLGLLFARLAAPDLAALGLVLGVLPALDAHSEVLRPWIEWNYTGLEAKEQFPAFREMAGLLHGSLSDPRVVVEYSQQHEKAGSIRMYETLPLFSGRSTLEGVYNQASLQTHFVYYVTSELGESSPNPFRSVEYSRFDTQGALQHLRLFNVSDVVALSPKLAEALAARPDVTACPKIPPYAIFHLRDHGPGYVEPLAYAPVRSPLKGWRDKAYRWFTRKPLSPAYLVFTDDPRVGIAEGDEWLPPPAIPLPPGTEVHEKVEAEAITIETNRIGHPLLVKVSYHPRWRAEGADGPYLVSPALMMVVPRAPRVRLVYSGTWSDPLGLALTIGALAWTGWAVGRRPRRRESTRGAAPFLPALACGLPPPPRRWGAAVPIAILLLLATGRLWIALHGRSDVALVGELYERASRAYAAEQYDSAAEYARHALAKGAAFDLREELLCLQGESLLRSGRAREAASAFETVTRDSPRGPHAAQALFGAARAHEAAGEPEAAHAARERLVQEYPETPWAKRVQSP